MFAACGNYVRGSGDFIAEENSVKDTEVVSLPDCGMIGGAVGTLTIPRDLISPESIDKKGATYVAGVGYISDGYLNFIRDSSLMLVVWNDEYHFIQFLKGDAEVFDRMPKRTVVMLVIVLGEGNSRDSFGFIKQELSVAIVKIKDRYIGDWDFIVGSLRTEKNSTRKMVLLDEIGNYVPIGFEISHKRMWHSTKSDARKLTIAWEFLKKPIGFACIGESWEDQKLECDFECVCSCVHYPEESFHIGDVADGTGNLTNHQGLMAV